MYSLTSHRKYADEPNVITYINGENEILYEL